MENKKSQKELKVFTIASGIPPKESVSLKKKFWSIDREMIRFKIHFFLLVGGLSGSLPYLPVFAKTRINLSASSLAAILFTQQFIFIFSKPLIGYMADYFNKLKCIIGVLTLIQGIFLFLILPIPGIDKTIKVYHRPHDWDVLSDINSLTLYKKCNFQFKCNGTSTEEKLLKATLACSFSPTSTTDSGSQQVIAQCSLGHNTSSTESTAGVQEEEPILKIKCIPSFNDYEGNDFTLSSTPPYEFTTLVYSFYSENDTDCLDVRKGFFSRLNESVLYEDNKSRLLNSFCCKNNDDYEISCLICKNVNIGDDVEMPIGTDFQTYQFWLYAFILTIAMICTNALFTLSDTACCDSVQKFGADFGRQRLWGAIGWGILAPVSGLINDYTDGFLASWMIMGGMSALALWNLCKLELVKPHFSQNILQDVGTVLKSKEFLAFELSVILNGMATGLLWSYFIWFLTSLGGSRLLCGLSLTVECFAGGIPFMFFSGWVIRKAGHLNILTMSLLAYSVRFFWCSQLSNPWYVLPVEVLHGVTNGLFYSGVASYAKASAKPGTEATTQAILFTSYEGIGCGLGTILSGLAYDHFGGHMTFFYGGVFCAGGALLSICSTLFLRMSRKTVQVTSPNNT